LRNRWIKSGGNAAFFLEDGEKFSEKTLLLAGKTAIIAV